MRFQSGQLTIKKGFAITPEGPLPGNLHQTSDMSCFAQIPGMTVSSFRLASSTGSSARRVPRVMTRATGSVTELIEPPGPSSRVDVSTGSWKSDRSVRAP